MGNGKTGVVILSVMGLLWCFGGSLTLPSVWRGIAGFGGLLISTALLYSNSVIPATPGKLDGRIFRLSVTFEFVGIGLVAWILIAAHYQGFIFPAVVIIVGLHFIGMWLATGKAAYATLAGVMCGTGLLAALMPFPVRTQISGIGSAIALWGVALQDIFSRTAPSITPNNSD